MERDDEVPEWHAHLTAAGWGWLIPAMSCIFALLVRTMDEMFFVGTGFAGPAANELVTARHVAEELLETQDSAPWQSKMIALMQTASGVVEIDIVGFNMSPKTNISSDLAVARLNPDQLEANGISLGRLPLRNERVEVGELLICVGFPNMPHKFNLDSDTSAFAVVGAPRIVEAPVTEVRDSIPNIPAPVFRMEFEMPGGMSGGPILRPNGDVVGICSYGNLDGPPWFCFGSMLAPLWLPYGEAEQWLP